MSSCVLQGIDLEAGGRNKQKRREAPKSENVYVGLLVKVSDDNCVRRSKDQGVYHAKAMFFFYPSFHRTSVRDLPVVARSSETLFGKVDVPTLYGVMR